MPDRSVVIRFDKKEQAILRDSYYALGLVGTDGSYLCPPYTFEGVKVNVSELLVRSNYPNIAAVTVFTRKDWKDEWKQLSEFAYLLS